MEKMSLINQIKANIQPLDFDLFSSQIIYPTILVDSKNYLIKIAEDEKEIKGAFRLRYEVFNLEQKHGLAKSYSSGIDFDEYDKFCIHIIVINKETARIMGTYRLHLGTVALKGRGFYSSSEFEIQELDKIVTQSLEVGRSCVSPEARNGATIALLWNGIVKIMFRAKLRYLFGCACLKKINPAAAWALYEYFKKENKIANIINGRPKKDYILLKPSHEEIEKYLKDIHLTASEFLSPLFKGYLRLGAKICSEPVYDPIFKTIDFLIIVDTLTIPERYLKHYKVNFLAD